MKNELEIRNNELRHLANYDMLTRLPNRLNFENTIKNVILSSQRHDRIFALLFIDLDNFKSVNDLHGHHVGDLLLKGVSEKLRKSFRKSDFVASFCGESFIARLGGDEFAVILDNLKDARGAEIAAKRMIEEVSITYELEKTRISTSVSIGIACYPIAGNDAEALYRNADAAMYVAKKSGKNSFCTYMDGMENSQKNA